MSEFIPGITLGGMLYEDIVRPAMAGAFPSIRYSAALIGAGSEVLGFDTELSTDHNWGPRLMLFLTDDGQATHADAIRAHFETILPAEFHGYPTRYSFYRGPVQHHIAPFTFATYFRDFFGLDIAREMTPADWLTITEQELRTITAGAVYHDDLGLEIIRERFAYYPRDIWLYQMASVWTRIGQEEHLMGRAGSVGDDLGAVLIAARLVHDLMRLCFLMERQYAPYPKWFGKAFTSLSCGPQLSPIFHRVFTALYWQEREDFLVEAYERVARMHNALDITPLLPEQASPFYTRSFRTINGAAFADALAAQIQDPDVQKIAARRRIGSVETFSDSTDLVASLDWRPKLRRLYEND